MWRVYRQKMNWAYFVLSQSRKQQYLQRGTVWLYIKENFPNNLILSTGKWAASGEHASLFLEVFKWGWAPSERVCQETLKASQGRWSLSFLLRVYESKPLSQCFPDHSPHGWSFPCVKLVSVNYLFYFFNIKLEHCCGIALTYIPFLPCNHVPGGRGPHLTLL